MARRAEADRRNKEIFKRFETMFNDDGLRCDIIYKRLAPLFYLSEQSIQKIVLKEAHRIKSARVRDG